jgi:hypothetical protein
VASEEALEVLEAYKSQSISVCLIRECCIVSTQVLRKSTQETQQASRGPGLPILLALRVLEAAIHDFVPSLCSNASRISQKTLPIVFWRLLACFS